MHEGDPYRGTDTIPHRVSKLEEQVSGIEKQKFDKRLKALEKTHAVQHGFFRTAWNDFFGFIGKGLSWLFRPWSMIFNDPGTALIFLVAISLINGLAYALPQCDENSNERVESNRSNYESACHSMNLSYMDYDSGTHIVTCTGPNRVVAIDINNPAATVVTRVTNAQ